MNTNTSYHYANFDERPDPSHRPLYLAAVLSHLTDKAERVGTVLDAGCGGGDFAIGLHQAGLKVYGLDTSESGIAAARQRGVGTFVVSSIYDSFLDPFGVASFDAVLAVEVIEHLYSPRVFVARAVEALRPGGLLIVTTPYWGYLKNIALAVSNRTDRALTPLWDGGHIKHWSRDTLTRLMQEKGLPVVAFYGCGEGIRRWIPYMWNSMMMVFRKPAL
jgi:2-polyprenyl-3-methyl-5-hydroxy-6-metoxy-1,4-benzoquinol methylase